MSKNKHDHTATKKIKAWLFAIMLLLPFLFLLPTGLYYGLNQNAQLSETTTENVNYYNTSIRNNYDLGDFETDTVYLCIRIQFTDITSRIQFDYLGATAYSNKSLSSNPGGYYLTTLDTDNDVFHLTINDYDYEMYNNVYDNPFIFAFNNNTQIENFEQFLQDIDDYEIQGCQIVIPNGTNSTTTYTNDISTSIINAWNSTWQNPLFSWTSYSPFYAPMQSFTNVFGINNMQIANVLTYLATITAIYIVFDIIIELFTYLTHLIPRSD